MRDSSEAMNNAMSAMSVGSISPNRCDLAILSSAALPATSRCTRSVNVTDGAIAFTRTCCAANSTARERVSAAVAPRDPHQRKIRRHVDHRSATRLDNRRNAEPATQERAEQIELDDAPELGDWRIHRRVVLLRRAAGIVV